MRPINPTFLFNWLSGLLATFSVRTRIIVLALVPVVGFIANGLTYISGEADVGTAFKIVNRSGTLADASRDFKGAVSTMRITVKDFAVSPSNNLVVNFEQAHTVALQSLDTIAASIDPRYADSIVTLRKDVMELRENFNELVREQETLRIRRQFGPARQPARCRQRS